MKWEIMEKSLDEPTKEKPRINEVSKSLEQLRQEMSITRQEISINKELLKELMNLIKPRDITIPKKKKDAKTRMSELGLRIIYTKKT
jgi:hypothetical protein